MAPGDGIDTHSLQPRAKPSILHCFETRHACRKSARARYVPHAQRAGKPAGSRFSKKCQRARLLVAVEKGLDGAPLFKERGTLRSRNVEYRCLKKRCVAGRWRESVAGRMCKVPRPRRATGSPDVGRTAYGR